MTGIEGKRAWSDEYLALYLLQELYFRRAEGAGAATLHGLSTLKGVPSQRDARVKAILEHLCSRGLVSQRSEDGKHLYEMTVGGAKWWVDHSQVLSLFYSLRAR